jgi:hypothetical protein
MTILVHFAFVWCIISGFGIMGQEKTGNPERVYNHCGLGAFLSFYGIKGQENQYL